MNMTDWLMCISIESVISGLQQDLLQDHFVQ